MKVGIYSPYLDTAGGGERYILTIAEIASLTHDVDVFLDTNLQKSNPEELKSLNERRLNLNLKGANFINAPFGKGSNALARSSFLKKYDVLVYLTDGSLFYSTAKKSILHIQSPIINKPLAPFNRIKLNSWDLIIYNSSFTKENCQRYLPIPSKIIYPPVDTERIKPGKKGKMILTVGRFFGYLKPKKHEEMIDAFKEIVDKKEIPGWSFHLAGGVEGEEDYLEELRARSKGYPIFFHPNIPFDDLVKLYGEASIYWHAAGLGEDDPARMEHFGITTVEAMAGGCIPVVINKGGQREIVDDGQSGFLWDSIEELKEITVKVVKDESLRGKVAKGAQKRAENFSKEKFEEEIKKLFNG